MNVLDVMEKRSSCRCFQDKPVPSEWINMILKAGIAAPTAHNTQAYKIIVVQGEKVREVSEVILEELNQYGKWKIPIGSSRRSARILRDAPVNFFLFMKKNKFFEAEKLPVALPGDYMEYIGCQNHVQSVISVGTVIENMLLAAEYLNLGAICISEICYAKDFCGNYFADILDLEAYEFVSSIALGYREDLALGKTKRKAIEDLVIFDREEE